MRKLILLLLFCTVCSAQTYRRPTYIFPDLGEALTTIADDTIVVADIADGDWGDFTISSNAASLDPNVVAASELASGDYGDVSISAAGVITIDNDVIDADTLANGDYGDVSISGGSITIDNDVIDADTLADGDYGDVSISSGSITIDNGVVQLADLVAGTAAGDIIYYTGAAWAILDCNQPGEVLTIGDSNALEWDDDMTLPDGGEIGPGAGNGGGNGKIKFNSSSSQIYILDGDVGIGTETLTAGTKLTVSEDTDAAALYIEWRADSDGDDNSDRWRWLIADGGTYVTLQYYGSGAWADVDWLGLTGADPDLDTAGQIGHDTDGANETGDSTLRGYDGSNQFLYASKLKYINKTLIEPDQIDGADLIPIWLNTTGMTATFVEWHAFSDDDDVSLEFECLTDRTDFTAITTMDAVEIATDGTSVYYANDTTWTSATVAHDDLLAVDVDQSDTPDYVFLCTAYWLNSNVD